jgi:hypothetical protein
VRYVEYLQEPADPGGFSLGGTGPTAEGFVAWVFGLGAAIVAALFVTRETRRHRAKIGAVDAAGDSDGALDAGDDHEGVRV